MKIRINSRGIYLRWLFLSFFLLISLFLQNVSAVSCQTSIIRPKVGLALSEGGACGIAHIGVLKLMEEAGLTPDYISGVSMGSLIGGLYAIGYSADSLEKLCKVIDWNLILSSQIPEPKIISPEKNITITVLSRYL